MAVKPAFRLGQKGLLQSEAAQAGLLVPVNPPVSKIKFKSEKNSEVDKRFPR